MTYEPLNEFGIRPVDLTGLEGVEKEAAHQKSSKLWMLSASSLILVVFLWWLLSDALSVIPTLYFPTMHQVGIALNNLGWTLATDAGATAWRVVVSWLIGCASGTVLGLVMARSKIAYYIINPLVEALRPVPPVALIPFTLLWFGLSDFGRIFLAAISCFMIMVVSTVVAARNVSPVYLRAARSLGAQPGQVYRTVVLRAILPSLVSAFRVAAALTWAVVVATEYLGAQSGIGYLILQASYTVNTAVVLIGVIAVGIEAFLFEQILRVGAAWITRWVDRAEGA